MPHKPLIILSLALTLLVSFDYLAAWTVPPSNPPSGNIAAPVNTGTTNQIKTGGLGVSSLNAASSLDGGGNVVGGVVRAENQMRADLYCDASGGNCFTPDLVGAGGGQSCTYETQTISGCQSAPSCPAGWTAVGAPLRQVASCGTSSQHDRYTVTCGRNVCTSGDSSSGSGFGYNQTWRSMVTQRSSNVWYHNNTDKPIMLYVGSSGSGVQVFM